MTFVFWGLGGLSWPAWPFYGGSMMALLHWRQPLADSSANQVSLNKHDAPCHLRVLMCEPALVQMR